MAGDPSICPAASQYKFPLLKKRPAGCNCFQYRWRLPVALPVLALKTGVCFASPGTVVNRVNGGEKGEQTNPTNSPMGHKSAARTASGTLGVFCNEFGDSQSRRLLDRPKSTEHRKKGILGGGLAFLDS